MVESVTSQISFPKLLSHTFPGIFVALGIFMIIDLVLFHDNISGFQIDIFEDWKTFLGTVSFLIFLGTIIGVIIDSIHHMIEKLIDTTDVAKNKFIKFREKIYKDLENKSVSYWYFVGFLPLEKVIYLNDGYYCYVECDFNLSISFFFSAFIYSSFLFLHGANLFKVGVIFIVLFILSVFCFYSGYKNYLCFKQQRVEFVKGAIEHPDRKP